jgi:hypothetical protein
MFLTKHKKVASDSAIMDTLRKSVQEYLASASSPINVEQVTFIVTSLAAGDAFDVAVNNIVCDRSDTASREQLVLDIVATFGTWVAHSLGRATDVYEYAAYSKSTAVAGAIEKFIPMGYEPSASHGRNLTKALSAIIYHKPDSGVINRFVARTYTLGNPCLNYFIVAGVWGLATTNRLANIDLISDDIVFHSQTIEAFDLLDIARVDANKAVDKLLTLVKLNPKIVIKLCNQAFWLDEYNFTKLRRAAELAATNKAGIDRFEYELKHLQRLINANYKAYHIEAVRSLTLSHVRHISTMAGLELEPNNTAKETKIRSILKTMNLDGDSDQLVLEALNCAKNGNLDKFWAVMQARISGDAAWAQQLSELRLG